MPAACQSFWCPEAGLQTQGRLGVGHQSLLGARKPAAEHKVMLPPRLTGNPRGQPQHHWPVGARRACSPRCREAMAFGPAYKQPVAPAGAWSA